MIHYFYSFTKKHINKYLVTEERFARVLKLALMCFVAMFIVAECSKDEGPPVGPGGGSLGNYKEPEMGNTYFGSILTFSGQVYKNTDKYADPYEKWNGNTTVYCYPYAYNENGDFTGKITNGQLSFTIGQPVPDYEIESLETVEYIFNNYQEFFLSQLYDNVAYSHPDVKSFIIWYLATEDYYGLAKGGYTYADQGIFAEYVFYIWVESDVRITAKGEKDKIADTFKDDIDMQLKAGWNAIYKRQAWSTEVSSCIKLGNPIGNPNLYWVIALD